MFPSRDKIRKLTKDNEIELYQQKVKIAEAATIILIDEQAAVGSYEVIDAELYPENIKALEFAGYDVAVKKQNGETCICNISWR